MKLAEKIRINEFYLEMKLLLECYYEMFYYLESKITTDGRSKYFV